MSRPRKPIVDDGVTVTFPPLLGEEIKRLARVANCEARDWVVDLVSTYIKEFRSGKDRINYDYSERDGSYYEGDEGCREPKRRL